MVLTRKAEINAFSSSAAARKGALAAHLKPVEAMVVVLS